jgi:nickel-type superoxide dismutase maturation protease
MCSLRPTVRRAVRRLAVLFAAGVVGSIVVGALGLAATAVVAVRRGTRRVVVEGRSMVPTLDPGDRLLVVRLPRWWPLWPGDVVALADPREPDRLLVKRVRAAGEVWVTVAGDNVAESTDSRSFGPVDRVDVWGRVCYRYAPPGRAGRVRRRPPSESATG